MGVEIKIPEGFREDFPRMTNFELSIKYIMPENRIGYLGSKLGLRKTKETKSRALGKITFTEEEKNYIRKNYRDTTSEKMARVLGKKRTLVRTKMYEMGLYRQRLEYWTEEQVDFLQNNYQEIGDVELAEIFQSKWHKKKGWTKSHIDKKRNQLGLHRTKEQLEAIYQRNMENGRWSECAIKRWETTGQAPEGEIRYWKTSNTDRKFPVIKIAGKWVHYGRYRWEQLHGPCPKGHNIVFLDGNPRNREDSNLGIMSDGELSRRNAKEQSIGMGDNYVLGIMTVGRPDLRETIRREYPQLIEIKRKQLILNRKINESLRTGSQAEQPGK